MITNQVVAQSAASMGKPDRVVEVSAMSPFCMAHTIAGIGNGEHAVSEEKPDPEAGGCEAEYGPMVRHGRP